MKAQPNWIRDIETRALHLPVVLVEGREDVSIFEYFFDMHLATRGWRQHFIIAEAGGKDHVRSGVVVHHPEWVGIIDMDERNPDDVQAAVAQSSHLRTLPRFCIESFFCHPNEIWAALPEAQRSRVGNDPETVAVPIYTMLPNWVEHGALWRILRRLYHTARIPADLDSCPIPDLAKMKTILQNWHNQLKPDVIIAEYEQELMAAQGLSRDEQIWKYVHGKRFFNQVIVQVLDHLFEGRGADDWLQKFRDSKMPPPIDLVAVLDWVNSSFP